MDNRLHPHPAYPRLSKQSYSSMPPIRNRYWSLSLDPQLTVSCSREALPLPWPPPFHPGALRPLIPAPFPPGSVPFPFDPYRNLRRGPQHRPPGHHFHGSCKPFRLPPASRPHPCGSCEYAVVRSQKIDAVVQEKMTRDHIRWSSHTWNLSEEPT